MHLRRAVSGALLSLGAPALLPAARAQAIPSKPLKSIVPLAQTAAPSHLNPPWRPSFRTIRAQPWQRKASQAAKGCFAVKPMPCAPLACRMEIIGVNSTPAMNAVLAEELCDYPSDRPAQRALNDMRSALDSALDAFAELKRTGILG